MQLVYIKERRRFGVGDNHLKILGAFFVNHRLPPPMNVTIPFALSLPERRFVELNLDAPGTTHPLTIPDSTVNIHLLAIARARTNRIENIVIAYSDRYEELCERALATWTRTMTERGF